MTSTPPPGPPDAGVSPYVLLDPSDLVARFYASPEGFGSWEFLDAKDLPELARTLLDHHDHMTVAMERYHGGTIDVEILRVQRTPQCYAREIALRRRSDGRQVQWGLVCIDSRQVPPGILAEIERGKLPLGRILIDNELLRTVTCERLFRFRPGPQLLTLADFTARTTMFGRTVRIRLGGSPVIDLVEIAVLPELGDERPSDQDPSS